MSNPQANVSAKRPRLVAITIPAAASNGSLVSTLLTAGGLSAADLELVQGVKVLGLLSDGTNRAAMLAHHVALSATITASGEHVIAGVDWFEPIVEVKDVYLRAAAGAAMPAIALCYLD